MIGRRKRGRPINENATMRLVDAAAEVLAQSGTEMDAFDMLREIYAQGLWFPEKNSKHADCSLRGEIVKEIQRSPHSRFIRVRRGYYKYAPRPKTLFCII